MSESVAWDGTAKSMSDVLAQEAQRLASSQSVYAVIDHHGQLFWKDTVLKQVPRNPSPEELAMMAPSAPLRPQVMLEAVDPSRGNHSQITMVRTGRTSIRGYRQEPGVARLHSKDYPVNLVARRVRAALARGTQQLLSDEELRGNLVLCGVGVDGGLIGLDHWQRQLIGVAYYAASTAAGAMSSYRVVGAGGGEVDVFAPEMYDPMTPEAARMAAWKLNVAADSAESGSSSGQHPVPAQTSSTAGREPRWSHQTLLKPTKT